MRAEARTRLGRSPGRIQAHADYGTCVIAAQDGKTIGMFRSLGR